MSYLESFMIFKTKAVQTFFVNLLLSFCAILIASITGWYLIIPVIFGIGIPLVNITSQNWAKVKIMFVICISSLAVFLITLGIFFLFEFKMIPFFFAGISGLIILVVNSLLVESVRITFFSAFLTFCLSSISLFLGFEWIQSYDTVLSLNKDLILIFFWIISITLGICSGIRDNVLLTQKN